MTVSIRQIHPVSVFAGEVSGIDITKPLSRDEVAAIEAGMDRYAVLVFHDQKVTDEQQMAFSLNFGVFEQGHGGNITKPEDRRLQVGMGDVSNLGKDGRPLPLDSRQRAFNLGNMLWHSDSSYRAIPAKYSILSARVVNPVGGNTEFADMRAAYDALDADTKALVEDLVCEHSLMYSRGSLGMVDYSDEERAMFRPVRQRLVRTHPVSGRRSLYLSAHAGAIIGMPIAGGAHPVEGSDRARHPAGLRLRAHVAHVGRGHVGQPADDASRPSLRRDAAARHAPHHHRGRHAHHRPGRGGLGRHVGGDAGRRDRRADLPALDLSARGRAQGTHVQPVPGRRGGAAALPLRPAVALRRRLPGGRARDGRAAAALDRVQPHRGRRVRRARRVAGGRARATVTHGAIGCAIWLNDQAPRPPRALANDEVLDLGGRRVRRLDTPHVPHCWDAGLLFEEATGTLFTSDLFTHVGDPEGPDRRRHPRAGDGRRGAASATPR